MQIVEQQPLAPITEIEEIQLNSWMVSAGLQQIPVKQNVTVLEEPVTNAIGTNGRRIYNKRNINFWDNHPKRVNSKEDRIVTLYKNGVDIGRIAKLVETRRTYVREILIRHCLLEAQKELSAKKPIIQMDQYGKIIAEFESMRAAHRELGITVTQIHRACTGRVKTAGEFIFKYKN